MDVDEEFDIVDGEKLVKKKGGFVKGSRIIAKKKRRSQSEIEKDSLGVRFDGLLVPKFANDELVDRGPKKKMKFEHPTCEHYSKTLFGHDHTFWKTFNLDDDVRKHFPASLLGVKLCRMRLDWLLHGKKCLANNFLNALYNMALTSPTITSEEREDCLENFRHLFIDRIRSSGCEFKTGSFKLSGKLLTFSLACLVSFLLI